ncbi:MAG: GIY-YIG nuclease family protein [Muribaculum sp.]|nr:GIY-YIG nuclease family protein [Muribaculum sp.]
MPTTIYTYLHNDDLNSSRIVSMDDCMCKLYNIKRDDSEFLKEFNTTLNKPALYILLNKKQRKAYIGETDDFTKRITQHISKKDFWDEVLVFLGSNDDTLSKTEVQHLEYLAYNKAAEVKSYNLSENTQSPKKPHMNLMQKGKTEKFFLYVQFLAKFVGCDIFERRPNVILTTALETEQPIVTPVPIDFTKEEVSGRIYLSLNGTGKYSKREIVLAIIKEFIKINPAVSFNTLKATFKRDYLGSFDQYEVLESDVDKAKNWKALGEDHVHYFINDVLTSGDGVSFVVCVEWERYNIVPILGIAKALGWQVEIVK